MGKDGHLTVMEITTILTMCKLSPNDITRFIETGTYRGDSTREAAAVFKRVDTIEIMESLYTESLNKALELKLTNIHHHLGDTIELLPSIVSGISPDEKCFWFLDAHQSGGDTGNNGEWVPLLRELDIILTGLSNPEGIYVIDDVRLFSKYWDWSEVSLESVLKKFENNNIKVTSHYIMNDRLILLVSNTLPF